MSKIVIIGGLSAGPSAAAKARREDENAEIIMFEKGANISYATCGMPYCLKKVQILVMQLAECLMRFREL